MLREILERKQERSFEKMADQAAEHLATAIAVSTLTVDDKQATIARYTKIFIDKFNFHMEELSSIDESQLKELLAVEVMSTEAMLKCRK